MKRALIIDLMELAVSLADTYLDGGNVAHILLAIVQKGVQAYEDQTGEALDLLLIKLEDPI